MKVSTLRAVDRWLGVPACAALTLARRGADLLGRPRPRPPRRIAFIKPAEQGSTVLACSAIRRAVELVGRSNVFFVVFESNRHILDVLELIPRDNVIPVRSGSALQVTADGLRAVARLRRLGVDTTIDLEFFSRMTAILGFLSGARRRVGLHARIGEGPYRGDLMTHRVRFNPHLHTARVFRLEVEAALAPPGGGPALDFTPPAADDPPPPFAPTGAERAAARKLLHRAGGRAAPGSGPLILLNPNCGDLLPLRAWPADRYVELARRLLARHRHARVALTGSMRETEAVESLTRQVGSPRCFSLAGRTTLRELLAVYCLADVLVTNDSGPAHFAALTPIDVITLFGPEHPDLFAARTHRNRVIRSGVACSPCLSALNNRTSTCRDNVCMQRIEVDRVFDEVNEMLAARDHDPRIRPAVTLTVTPRALSRGV